MKPLAVGWSGRATAGAGELLKGIQAQVGFSESLLRSPFLIATALYSFTHSRVFPDKEATFDAALALAAEIATKSPVAVQGTKVNLLYSRDHSVAEGLNHMVRLFI